MGKTFRANSKSYGTSEGSKGKHHKKKNTLKEDRCIDYVNTDYNDIYELDDLENSRNRHKMKKEKCQSEFDYSENENEY